MLKKFTNKKGFTLMEMLIVVAIIAVLVAIAIPTFSGALTKAKEATDVANIRAAYAEWQVDILSNGEDVPASVNDDSAASKFTSKLADDLNSPSCLKAAAKAANGTLTITYESTKLTGGNGSSDNVFTWTLKPLDIN